MNPSFQIIKETLYYQVVMEMSSILLKSQPLLNILQQLWSQPVFKHIQIYNPCNCDLEQRRIVHRPVPTLNGTHLPLGRCLLCNCFREVEGSAVFMASHANLPSEFVVHVSGISSSRLALWTAYEGFPYSFHIRVILLAARPTLLAQRTFLVQLPVPLP